MASTAARARLLQLQRRFSFGLFHHHQQQHRYSSSPLLKGHTTLPHSLPSSGGVFWSRGFATATNPNQGKQDEKSESDNRVKRTTTKRNKKSGFDGDSIHYFRTHYVTPSKKRDFVVEAIHSLCGAKNERLVCKQCYQTGLVVGRCSACSLPIVFGNPFLPFSDFRLSESFVCSTALLVEDGSDETVNYVFEERKDVDDNVCPIDDTHNCDFVGMRWLKRDAIVESTCDCCGAPLKRMVYKQALNEGTVLTRCNGCNKIVVVADYYGVFKPPNTADPLDYSVRKFQTKNGKTVIVSYSYEKYLKEGSEETLNITYEIRESINGMNVVGSLAIQMNSEPVSSC